MPQRKARDKVSLKHLGSYTRGYDSQSEMSPGFSPQPFQATQGQMSSSLMSDVYSDYAGSPDAMRQRGDVYQSDPEQDFEAQGPYIVEMGGSQNQTPRVITVADLNNQQDSKDSKGMRTLAAAASVAHAMSETNKPNDDNK